MGLKGGEEGKRSGRGRKGERKRKGKGIPRSIRTLIAPSIRTLILFRVLMVRAKIGCFC